MNLRWVSVFAFSCGALWGQTQTEPLTRSQLRYFEFALESLATAERSELRSAREQAIVAQAGLDSRELELFRSAAASLRPTLLAIRSTGATRTADLATLTSQRERAVESLASEILRAVRPGTAIRLKLPGTMIDRMIQGVR